MDNMSLVDRYCPEVHQAPLTAADYDPGSRACITADAWGWVAITRPGDEYPNLVFQPGGPVRGAVALSPGGTLAAVGDDYGTIAVYRTADGTCVFHDVKEQGGEQRAMRACTFDPQGTVLATLSVDGVVRVFHVQRWERLSNYRGFDGQTLQFDARGQRLLVVDNLGQPKILDLQRQEIADMDMIPGGCQAARFTPGGRHAVCLGVNAIHLVALSSGNIERTFNTTKGSGLISLCFDPQGRHVACISRRSAHTLALPDLQPIRSEKHGAEHPTRSVIWDHRGIAVGGEDGRLHRPGRRPSLDPVLCVTGYGEHRVAVHGERIAVWHKHRRRRPFKGLHPHVEVKISRDGRVLCALPAEDAAGLQVFDAKSGRHLFDAGPDTVSTPQFEVGRHIVACQSSNGGLRWFDLQDNQEFALDWPRAFALSGGGTWLGVVTPRGTVRVLDPATGEDAIPAPEPLAEDCPVRLLSFVNRRPDLLVLDEEGVLGVYDLAPSVTESRPARGRDVLELNVAVDRLWGLTGGRHAALRFQDYDNDTATVIYVDLKSGEVISEVSNLLPYVWVDPEDGSLLQPARGNAILEHDMHGEESRVLRSLPDKAWIAFDERRILDRG